MWGYRPNIADERVHQSGPATLAIAHQQAHPLSLPLPILAGMDTTELTRHARVRMQQHGIGSEVLDHLFAYGRIVHDHHGAEIVYFDRAARRRLAEERGEEAIRRLGKRLGAFAVIGADGKVRTVGYRTRRINR